MRGGSRACVALFVVMALGLVLALPGGRPRVRGKTAQAVAQALAQGQALAQAQVRAQEHAPDREQTPDRRQDQDRGEIPAVAPAVAAGPAPDRAPGLRLGTGSSPGGGQAEAEGQGHGQAAGRPATRATAHDGLIIDPETALGDALDSEAGLSLDQLGQAIGRTGLPGERARLRLKFAPTLSALPTSSPPALHLEIPKIEGTPISLPGENTFTILQWGTARVLLGDGSEGKWVAAEQSFQLNSSWEAEARLFSPVHSGMVVGGAQLWEGMRLELAARSQAWSVEASLPVKDEPSLQAKVAYELGKGARVNAAYRVDVDGISVRSSTVVGVGLSLGENASLSASYRLVKWNENGNEESHTETPAQEAEASLQFRF